MSSLSTSVIWELTMCNVGTATIRPSRLWEYSMLCNCFTTCPLLWKDVLWREELPKLEHLAFKTRFKIYKLTLLINQDIFIIATENFKDSFKFSRPSLQVNNNDESALTHEKQWQQLDYKMFITLSSLSSTTCLAFDIIILSPIPSSSSSSSSSLHHLHHHHHHVYHHQHHYQDCY